MFNNLSEKLDKALHVLKGHGRITEINVAETLKEVRRALLDADVNYKIAKDFTSKVKEKALGQNVLTTLQPGQLMVKIVKDELTALMGGDAAEVNLSASPSVILMSGLQGSGKTTFSGKLAQFLKTKKSKKPMLVACDVYRPAAIDQLHIISEQLGVEVYSDPGNTDPVAIAQAGIVAAKSKACDIAIVDTAGRLAVDQEMMTEISNIHSAIKPQETLFVVDAMTGQDAVNTAKSFNDILNFSLNSGTTLGLMFALFATLSASIGNLIAIYNKRNFKIVPSKDSNILDLEKSLIDKTGINVEIKNNKNNSGKLSFEYKNLEQLDRLINIIRNNY